MRDAFVHELLAARDYQDRPEFEALCDWWRGGGTGVCALVGMGGAGKTALAERFLRVLPGGLAAARGLGKRDDLPRPEAVFLFSFYNVPNPDTFFGYLHAWLRGEVYEEGGRLPAYQEVLQELGWAGEGRLLVVLDGLEKVQDDGIRSGRFGQIVDGRLRDLVLRAADGYLPGASLLITTRFPLYDPMASRSWHYRAIEVEQLEPGAAVALLRARGVRGTDLELEALARAQGYHALTVDLMGGYVALFCDGDPGRLGAAEVLPEDEGFLDPRVAVVRRQERMFARVAARYAEGLGASDPAALALLQRVCLFRLGVEAGTLAGIFLGAEKVGISGEALAGLSRRQLEGRLKRLAGMRLLEAGAGGRYTSHPAIRDGFALEAGVAVAWHEAIRASLMGALPEGLRDAQLSGARESPSDPAVLDLLEEIVYHTLRAGHAQEAFVLYWYRMGTYENLGWRLGGYERGERICRAFAGGQAPEAAPLPAGLSEAAQCLFANEWALYLGQLGRLDAAAACYGRNIEMRMRQEDWGEASTGNRNLAEVHLRAGRLGAGVEAAGEALRLAERTEDAQGRCSSHAYRGYARGLRGETAAALEDFRQALEWQHEVDGERERSLYGLRGIWHAELLARLGRREEAARLTEANHEICVDVAGQDHMWFPDCHLLLADLARAGGDLSGARGLLGRAHDWALARDDRVDLCGAALVRARIERDAGEISAASLAVDEGLRLARECGYGILHTDLLLVGARLCLLQGDADGAEGALGTALAEGVRPAAESGYPELLAATDEACGYAWGIAEGRHLLAEVYLLRAAQALGEARFAPEERAGLPAEVRGLIGRAEEELGQAGEVCRRLAPDGETEVPLAEVVRATVEGLARGELTRYPVEERGEEREEKGEEVDRIEVVRRPAERYVDFELHIGPRGHVVASCKSTGQDRADITTEVTDDIRLGLDGIERGTAGGDELKEVGRALYHWLFPGPIHTHLEKTVAVARVQGAKVRIRLRVEAEEIARLPLEFLYREVGGHFLAVNPDTVLSRYLQVPAPGERVRRRTGALHLLAIVADVRELPRLDAEEWEGILREALAGPLAAGQMTMEMVKRATRREIHRALLKQEPDLVQFVGHGSYRGGKGYVVLVDEDTGGIWDVDDEQFAGIFMGFDDHLGLICLAACKSAASEDPQGFRGIAPKLVGRGVPAVVAMQYKVGIPVAKVFLEEFYAAVAEGKPVDWATQTARNQVSLEFGLDGYEFATPVLYMRARDGEVFG